MARRTGVTEAGFCIATEDRPREGSSKVPAEGVRRGVGVCSCNRATGRRPGGWREGNVRRKDSPNT